VRRAAFGAAVFVTGAQIEAVNTSFARNDATGEGLILRDQVSAAMPLALLAVALY
jgi:hypothetical protein